MYKPVDNSHQSQLVWTWESVFEGLWAYGWQLVYTRLIRNYDVQDFDQ